MRWNVEKSHFKIWEGDAMFCDIDLTVEALHDSGYIHSYCICNPYLYHVYIESPTGCILKSNVI